MQIKKTIITLVIALAVLLQIGCTTTKVSPQDNYEQGVSAFEAADLYQIKGTLTVVDRAGEQYKVGFDGAVVNHKDAVLTLKPVIKGSEVELKNALIYKNGVFYTDLSVYATLMFDLFHEDADFFIDATNGRKVSLFDVNNFANLSYINTLKTILTPIKTDALENKVKQVNDTTYRLSFDTTDNKSVTDAVKEALARNDSQIQSDLVAFYSAVDNNAYLNACLTAASSLLGDEGLANNIASLRTLSDIRTLIGHTASGTTPVQR